MNIKYLSLIMVALTLASAVHIHAAKPETRMQTAQRWGKGVGYGIVGTGAAVGSVAGCLILLDSIVSNTGRFDAFGGISLSCGLPPVAIQAFQKCSAQFTDAEKNKALTYTSPIIATTSLIAAVNFFSALNKNKNKSDGKIGYGMGALISTALTAWYGKKTYNTLFKKSSAAQAA